MNDFLKEYVGARVSVICNDGRHLIGKLVSADKLTNLILNETIERVYSPNAPVQSVELGLLLVKGDNCAMVGPIVRPDQIRDDVMASPLRAITH